MDKQFDIIYINALNKEELQWQIDKLKDRYKEVLPHVGRFIGTAEYYGEIYVR